MLLAAMLHVAQSAPHTAQIDQQPLTQLYSHAVTAGVLQGLLRHAYLSRTATTQGVDNVLLLMIPAVDSLQAAEKHQHSLASLPADWGC